MVVKVRLRDSIEDNPQKMFLAKPFSGFANDIEGSGIRPDYHEHAITKARNDPSI